MYCPKCKDNFEEGSRRFCPTDGSRLISESIGDAGNRTGGIFANLLPKIEAAAKIDEPTPEIPRFIASKSAEKIIQAPSRPQEAPDTLLELELPDPKPIANPKNPGRFIRPEPELRPIARKVQPFEIPAGHVNLNSTDRSNGISAEFDENNPERFVGRVVKGRYWVTEFLGGDEAGLAFLAEDKIVVTKKVLVRILIDDDDDEIMRSILAEERISLSHFSHPNMARLIDSGQFTNGTNFLVSEYIDALSVNDILTIHGHFGACRAARAIRQAANALNEAHQGGIIHRDIRPENLIIDSSGDAEQIRVVNFGASNGNPNEYNISYKSPEVLDGRIATIASDIFSLGVVAYEMLTGKTPFDGSTAKEIMRSQKSRVPPTVATSLPAELTESVDGVIRKALAFRSSDRFTKTRDFGDALYSALTQPIATVKAGEPLDAPDLNADQAPPPVLPLPTLPKPEIRKSTIISLPPATTKTMRPTPEAGSTPAPPPPAVEQPAWRNRSPEPPEVGDSRTKLFAGIGILALIFVLFFGWYFLFNGPVPPDQAANESNLAPMTNNTNSQMPPFPRNIQQPPNSNFFENSKQNLKGDLLRNFVGFTLYYPKDWKVNGPLEGSTSDSRGKFLDISRVTPDGLMREQMLISYYPSKGTFSEDNDKFAAQVKETNETLKNLLPGYQMISEGEIKLNGDWHAYEVKFQGSGTSESGEKLFVWGRRLFIPASRPGVRNGFEITMLATSLAVNVKGVDDVGVRGELASVLDTFEPGQNF